MKITGKNIVLTGASGGIGLEMLNILAKEKSNKILAVSRHAEQLLAYYSENVFPFDTDLGSAAGVVVMGLERITFGWYMRRISWVALAGYLAGIACYWLGKIFVF